MTMPILRPHVRASTVDDLMREVTELVLASGEVIEPTSGLARDLWGATLELDNPLARISRSATRGKIFSALGELCWYLAGSSEAAFIRYYLPRYPNIDHNVVLGAYGPRLRDKGGVDQIGLVVDRLRGKPASRRAIIQIYDATDGLIDRHQPPCTSTFQFLVRDHHLHMITTMRSNDIYWGLAHDLFAFTMLQELVSRAVGIPLGAYLHAVGSLHLYEHNLADAERYLAEGWQQSTPVMPAMPSGDPWESVEQLLQAERALRIDGLEARFEMPREPYWADLARLLAIFALTRSGVPSNAATATRLAALRRDFDCGDYDIFVADHLDKHGGPG